MPFDKVTEGHVGHEIWVLCPLLYEDPASEVATQEAHLSSLAELNGI